MLTRLVLALWRVARKRDPDNVYFNIFFLGPVMFARVKKDNAFNIVSPWMAVRIEQKPFIVRFRAKGRN